MTEDKLPKARRRRSSETLAMRRIVEKQVKRVSEDSEASDTRRREAQELRDITDACRLSDDESPAEADAGADSDAHPATGSES